MKESPVFTKMYDLLLWLFPHTAKFPKTLRHTLTNRIENTALESYRKLVGAAMGDKVSQEIFLQEADIELQILKMLVRISCDMKLMSKSTYGHFCSLAEEVGRLIGGWRNSLKRGKVES